MERRLALGMLLLVATGCEEAFTPDPASDGGGSMSGSDGGVSMSDAGSTADLDAGALDEDAEAVEADGGALAPGACSGTAFVLNDDDESTARVSLAVVGETIAIARTVYLGGGELHFVDGLGEPRVAVREIAADSMVLADGERFLLAGSELRIFDANGAELGAPIALDPRITQVFAMGVERGTVYLYVRFYRTDGLIAVAPDGEVQELPLPDEAPSPGTAVAHLEGSRLSMATSGGLGFMFRRDAELLEIDASARPPVVLRKRVLGPPELAIVAFASRGAETLALGGLVSDDLYEAVWTRITETSMYTEAVGEDRFDRSTLNGAAVATAGGAFVVLSDRYSPATLFAVDGSSPEQRLTEAPSLALALAHGDRLGVTAAWVEADPAGERWPVHLRCGLER